MVGLSKVLDSFIEKIRVGALIDILYIESTQHSMWINISEINSEGKEAHGNLWSQQRKLLEFGKQGGS